MPRWNARERQRMVEEYLREAGVEVFVPREFLSWLRPQKKHPLHATFFGRSDREMAEVARLAMVRSFVSGLRITVRDVTPVLVEIGSIVMRETPLLLSPVDGRRFGGGYVEMDVTDPVKRAELLRQGASALDGWIGRYAGAAEAAGVDVMPIRRIAAALAAGGMGSAVIAAE